MYLEKTVQKFFTDFLPLEKPLLVGFSGGEDSMSLTHCLYKQKIPFHLAHFDHAWRETSREEALFLKAWAQERRIPFYSKRSSQQIKSECVAREQRFAFFEELFYTGSFCALVLAHHLIDQAETVLKRVLEGTHLTTLKGMRPLSSRREMPIWRPMLQVSKQEIRDYIAQERLNPLIDSTNFDPSYLRARMRTRLFPELTKAFGKEIIPSLQRLGDYAAELEDYLMYRTEGVLPVEGPFGLMWDFSNAHPVEIRYILKQHLCPSCSIFDRIICALMDARPNYTIKFSDQTLIADRGHLFWVRRPLPVFSKKILLEPCKIEEGEWVWEITFVENPTQTNWLDVWKGKISLALPKGKYQLVPPGGAFRKKWNTHKIPAFLREMVPIVTDCEGPVKEFLTQSSEPAPFAVAIEIKQKEC